MYNAISSSMPGGDPASAYAPLLNDSDGSDDPTPGLSVAPYKPQTKRTFKKTGSRIGRIRKAMGADEGFGGIAEYRRGESRAGENVALQRLARKIKLFAIKFALYTNGRSFDIIDDRLLDEDRLADFVKAGENEDVRSEQFEILMGVFKEKAFGAIHTCLGYLESSEYQLSTNRALMGMNLRSWFNNAKIANNLAQLAAFYAVQPKYMNTSKWPRKEILAQWQNSNHETMDFFLNYDTYA